MEPLAPARCFPPLGPSLAQQSAPLPSGAMPPGQKPGLTYETPPLCSQGPSIKGAQLLSPAYLKTLSPHEAALEVHRGSRGLPERPRSETPRQRRPRKLPRENQKRRKPHWGVRPRAAVCQDSRARQTRRRTVKSLVDALSTFVNGLLFVKGLEQNQNPHTQQIVKRGIPR